jgi:hypothetical protein
MKRDKPPFRADHVGSFLRTAAIKEARAKREKDQITADELKAVEDAEIKKTNRKSVASSSRPTASFAARGGTSISSAGSTASR